MQDYLHISKECITFAYDEEYNRSKKEVYL